jgi:hypothetical protein
MACTGSMPHRSEGTPSLSVDELVSLLWQIARVATVSIGQGAVPVGAALEALTIPWADQLGTSSRRMMA